MVWLFTNSSVWKENSQWLLNGTDCTHVEDMEDPIEVLLPTSDRIFVAPCAENSRDRASFTLFDDIPLNLSHSSAMETLVSGLLSMQIADRTDVVSCPIAPRTDWLSSSNCLPFNPRSRA